MFGQALNTTLLTPWLDLQCRMIGGTVRGVVLLPGQGKDGMGAAACWPGTPVGNALFAAARRGGIRSAGQIEALPAQDHDAAHHMIACPIHLGRDAIGVVAIEVAQEDRVRLEAALQLLQWGGHWLELLVRQHGRQQDAGKARLLKQLALLLGGQGQQAWIDQLADTLHCSQVAFACRKGGHWRLEQVSGKRDIDARMNRTRGRPFVTGQFTANGYWLAGIGLLLATAITAAALATNAIAAFYVFLGAFVYGVVYTVWLKRRTWMNIVVGGLAGSFAVLAGAAAVDPGLAPAPVILAIVLFLWTPPHFWSLAFKYRDDYAKVGVPMLPVVVSQQAAAYIILGHTLLLAVISLLPVLYGLGWIYFLGAAIGGARFVWTSIALARNPSPETAMTNFHASLLQLSLLLIAAILDAWLM